MGSRGGCAQLRSEDASDAIGGCSSEWMWWRVADTQTPEFIALVSQARTLRACQGGALLTASTDTHGCLLFQPERLRCAQLPAEGSAPLAKSERLIQVPAPQPGRAAGLMVHSRVRAAGLVVGNKLLCANHCVGVMRRGFSLSPIRAACSAGLLAPGHSCPSHKGCFTILLNGETYSSLQTACVKVLSKQFSRLV